MLLICVPLIHSPGTSCWKDCNKEKVLFSGFIPRPKHPKTCAETEALRSGVHNKGFATVIIAELQAKTRKRQYSN